MCIARSEVRCTCAKDPGNCPGLYPQAQGTCCLSIHIPPVADRLDKGRAGELVPPLPGPRKRGTAPSPPRLRPTPSPHGSTTDECPPNSPSDVLVRDVLVRDVLVRDVLVRDVVCPPIRTPDLQVWAAQADRHLGQGYGHLHWSTLLPGVQAAPRLGPGPRGSSLGLSPMSLLYPILAPGKTGKRTHGQASASKVATTCDGISTLKRAFTQPHARAGASHLTNCTGLCASSWDWDDTGLTKARKRCRMLW